MGHYKIKGKTMKLTKSGLRTIIKEELANLNEEEYMGHYKIKGKDIFVDSNFVNKSKGALGGRLKHMGFGEFYLSTSKGDIQFIRTSEKISGFVGRAHRLSDNEDGKLAGKLVKQMVKDGNAEKV